MDTGGLYDRQKFNWEPIGKISLCASCNPAIAGQENIPARLLRQFFVLALPEPSPDQQIAIFEHSLAAFLARGAPLESYLMETVHLCITAAVELCARMKLEFTPSPGRAHYTFNLRDVAKCVAGLMQASPSTFSVRLNVSRLFAHESLRVFHDRLINEADRTLFRKLLCDMLRIHFRESLMPSSLRDQAPVFSDFCGSNDVIKKSAYVEITDFNRLNSTLSHLVDEMNAQAQRQDVLLVMFEANAQHALRISRILRQKGGHALLIGPSGVGKRAVVRLSCYITGNECIVLDGVQLTVVDVFRAQLREAFLKTGLRGKSVTLLVKSSAHQTILEDLSCFLAAGDVEDLFDRESRENLLDEMRLQETGSFGRDQLYDHFLKRVKDNLHVVVLVPSSGEDLTHLVRGHPSLVNRLTIDYFDSWTRDALLQVARARLLRAQLAADENREAVCHTIATVSVKVHEIVAAASQSFLPPDKRHYYTTPVVYFELLDLFAILHDKKKKDILANKERLQSGLSMLAATREAVTAMQAELLLLEPELQRRAESASTLLLQLQTEEDQVTSVEASISADEARLMGETRGIEALSEQAQNELDATLPALEAAYDALDALDKNDIAEIRVYAKPPQMVMRVMSAVSVLLERRDDWATAKQMLADPGFLRKLRAYKKNSVPPRLLEQIVPYVSDPRFNPDDVGKISSACRSMCMWVRAIDNYARVSTLIAPKREKCNSLKKDLDEALHCLRGKQLDLAKVQVQLGRIREQYASSVHAHQELNERIQQARERLRRASDLMTVLRAEEQRWLADVASLDQQFAGLLSASFLSACCVVYYGAFTQEFRKSILAQMIGVCEASDFQVYPAFCLIDNLTTPTLVDRWRMAGLPEDTFSTENGILVTSARRCPLLIDPQGQANSWIRKLENMTWLYVTSPSDHNMIRTLQAAMRGGRPVLLEDVGATLDPILEPLLLRQTRSVGGQLVIRIGDVDMEYDRNFRLYMTTRLGNASFSPDVCAKVTIVNFAVSIAGLEEQLLCDVVQRERPRLERKRLALAGSISTDRSDLRETEDKILRL